MAMKHRIQLLHGRLKQHEELVDHLRDAPEHEALAIIRRLRSTGNLTDTLASLSGRTEIAVRPSNIDTARAMQPPTGSQFEFELNLLYHSVYPPLEPLECTSVALDGIFARSFHRGLVSSVPQHTDRIGFGETNNVQSTVHTLPAPLSADDVDGDHYVDFRLSLLQVEYWTQVPIDNGFAARVISHYLENDHPLWGCFDADLFLSDLVDHRLDACSPFLFNALMAFACVSGFLTIRLIVTADHFPAILQHLRQPLHLFCSSLPPDRTSSSIDK